MKMSLALLTVALLALVTPPVRSDQAGARAALEKEGIAVTPEAFLQKVAEGDAKHAALFVEAGIDPSARNGAQRTALWIATEQRQLAVLQALLAAGVTPNEKNAPLMEYGKSIVFEAVDSGDAAFVRALVEAGADARTANEYGVPPLAEAARTGRLEMCEILLKAGADPNAAPGGFPLLYGPVNESISTSSGSCSRPEPGSASTRRVWSGRPRPPKCARCSKRRNSTAPSDSSTEFAKVSFRL